MFKSYGRQKGNLEFIDSKENTLTIDGKVYYFFNPNVRVKKNESLKNVDVINQEIEFILKKGLITEISKIQDKVIDLTIFIIENNEYYYNHFSLFLSYFLKTFRDYTSILITFIGIFVLFCIITESYEIIFFPILSFGFFEDYLNDIIRDPNIHLWIKEIIIFFIEIDPFYTYTLLLSIISLISYLFFRFTTKDLKITKNQYSFHQSVFVNLYLLDQK